MQFFQENRLSRATNIILHKQWKKRNGLYRSESYQPDLDCITPHLQTYDWIPLHKSTQCIFLSLLQHGQHFIFKNDLQYCRPTWDILHNSISLLVPPRYAFCAYTLMRTSAHTKDHVTNEEVCAKIKQAIRPHEDLLTIVKRRKLKWYGHISISSGLANSSCKTQWKGEEDKADRKRGGKTTSGNGQAWSSPSPRRQWRTDKNAGNWLWSHLLCPNYPHG